MKPTTSSTSAKPLQGSCPLALAADMGSGERLNLDLGWISGQGNFQTGRTGATPDGAAPVVCDRAPVLFEFRSGHDDAVDAGTAAGGIGVGEDNGVGAAAPLYLQNVRYGIVPVAAVQGEP